jgi:16S rRNA (guanine966-N2)-methyltransferase
VKRALGELRLIGGEWRSRRVHFDADPVIGLRATPDRVRQTAFDWLAPMIRGARCLDLFAGSGAMGLEALSRGAAHCTFVDTGAGQCRDIRTALRSLQGEDRAEVVQADARRWLEARHGPFDVVFLDPPFDSHLLAEVLPRLESQLSHPHRLYVEWRGEARPAWPQGLQWLREKQAGQVSYGLSTFGPPP